jgi:hypothetical protein
MFELGKGGMGSVTSIYDFKSNKRYAVKSFRKAELYELEKYFMTHVEKKLGEEFEKVAMKLMKYDDDECELWYDKGVCSLREFA